jgi:7-cyano-7-deazaguanosine (preQ0) biosynthesis protein QueE
VTVDGIDTELPVAEIIPSTIQGEGPAAGRHAAFVRFMGCNLSCSWCDTRWTWDGSTTDLRSETTLMTVDDIVKAVDAGGAKIVVITGGEPLLQQARGITWRYLLRALSDSGMREVHIETNGTLAPDAVTLKWADTIVVSPKLLNAGSHRGRQNPAMHPGWKSVVDTHNIHLKIVCVDHVDVETAASIADAWDWPRDHVWVMPEGQTTDALRGRWQRIAEHAAQVGVNATHRLHVLAWGHERGH